MLHRRRLQHTHVFPLHVAAVDGAAAQHQQVGVGIVSAQPLLRKRQQLGHTGQVQQGGHTVRDAIGLLLKEHGAGGEVPGAHGICSTKMQPKPSGLMKGGTPAAGHSYGCWLGMGLSLEGFRV